MLKTPLGRFRAVALLEGLSFIVLLFIAMPLKYLAGMPQAVRFVGMAHGLLFVLYLFALMEAAISLRWGFVRVVMAFGASLVPFGNFLLDARLRQEERAAVMPPAP
jgi:integral membrane protein